MTDNNMNNVHRARRCGRRSMCAVAVVSLFVTFQTAAQAASPPRSENAIVLAQAGSAGGYVTPPATLGKRDKSVSGGAPEPAPVVRPKPEAARPARPRQAARPAAARCPNIAGVWSSWASGVMGKGDTTFGSDGSAFHRAGIRGKWWCEAGQLHIEWPDGRPGLVMLSGNRIVGPDGKVHMTRD
jgi:hypothetical protein